jgi:hypothetical protein
MKTQHTTAEPCPLCHAQGKGYDSITHWGECGSNWSPNALPFKPSYQCLARQVAMVPALVDALEQFIEHNDNKGPAVDWHQARQALALAKGK